MISTSFAKLLQGIDLFNPKGKSKYCSDSNLRLTCYFSIKLLDQHFANTKPKPNPTNIFLIKWAFGAKQLEEVQLSFVCHAISSVNDLNLKIVVCKLYFCPDPSLEGELKSVGRQVNDNLSESLVVAEDHHW